METITPTLSSLIAKEANKKFVVQLILIFALSISFSYANNIFQTALCGNANASCETADRPFPSGAIYFNNMKEIKLSKGKITLVDDEDYEYLTQWKWHANGSRNVFYACRTDVKNNRALLRMHREIMRHHNLLDETKEIDHIDRIPLNNQKSNLRNCTHAENCRNQTSHKNTSSKYLGVHKSIQIYFVKRQKKYAECIRWMARITLNNKRVYLGRFKTETDAALAYNQAAKKYYGEFANLNKI